jgi:hypothetical protein
MFIFGTAFQAAWSVADAAAKGAAAAISTGANAVGSLPVVAATAENQLRESYQSASGAVQSSWAGASSSVAVSAAQWKAWMDTKVAGIASALGADVDPAQVARSGQANIELTQAEQNRRLDALVEHQQDQINTLSQADAARLAAAQKIQAKISAAGTQAGTGLVDAVESAKPAVSEFGHQADLMAISEYFPANPRPAHWPRQKLRRMISQNGRRRPTTPRPQPRLHHLIVPENWKTQPHSCRRRLTIARERCWQRTCMTTRGPLNQLPDSPESAMPPYKMNSAWTLRCFTPPTPVSGQHSIGMTKTLRVMFWHSEALSSILQKTG